MINLVNLTHNKGMKNKFIYIIIFLFISITFYRLYNLMYVEKDKYIKEFKEINNKIITINNSPRGRILDTNGKILVDNEGVNTLIYNKLDNNTKTELEIVKKLSKLIDIDASNISEYKLKRYYLVTHDNGTNLLKNSEKEKYKRRKLTEKDIESIKDKRIANKMLDEIDKKEAYIYDKISTGYSYEDKIIKTDLTPKEVSSINDLNDKSLRVDLTYKRVYPYGDTFRNILGTIGKIPKEKKDYYLKKGIALDSIVGTSFLEEEYDDELRGTNSIYTLKKIGSNYLKKVKVVKT